MAATRNKVLAVALPCLIVAIVSLLQYRASGGDADNTVPNIFRRIYGNVPVPQIPVDNNTDTNQPGSQQNPQVAPPVPVLDLSESYILAALSGNGSSGSRTARSSEPNNSTLRMRTPSGGHGLEHTRFHSDTSLGLLNTLTKRDADNCSPDLPCADGSELHCGNPDPNGLTPCQEGFGRCSQVPPPTCNGNSANGRSIGYYQASNTRTRLCNRIDPEKIDTEGLTHLYFAFASIDPNTYAVVPDNPIDVDIYPRFTKLQSSSLETWIAIGGYDFSDEERDTHFTWSRLAESAANRAAFIQSLMDFMSKYGFQGADIDWEYPGLPERGGKRADTQNFVTLVREMHEAFAGKYGLSVVLAPDYWYLRFFDAKAMEPYVDMFGFMAYDLHGPWDAKNRKLGPIVRGQTDIREIYNNTLPLWFEELNPAKINFGLAYYGRGYTLAVPSCNELFDCKFIGPSLPAPCTNYGGVMSLAEIKFYIRNLGLQPKLLPGAMMKQITWENQWIGYDDEETTALKKTWASGYCFGGTMIWSIDFKNGGGSNSNDPSELAPITKDDGPSGDVYIDPAIWNDTSPVISCIPPCQYILPPITLNEVTTITFPLYTTSLQVAWRTTIVTTLPGGEVSTSTTFDRTVQTTTLTIPPLTTSKINVWNVNITAGVTATPITLTSSILPPPFTITDDRNPRNEPGVTHPVVHRTVTPPPYPYWPPGPVAPSSTTPPSGVLPLTFDLSHTSKAPPGPTCRAGCG
ncbi:MAG: hypothetical protein Q9183_003206, partial [Haloplaca sp. 2 TL-2023]